MVEQQDVSRQKVALVTGANSGIGAATAQRFAAAGWTTFAAARRPEALRKLEADGFRAVFLDVTDAASMTAAVKHIEEQVGAIDVLVNNAGYGEMGPVEEVPLERVRRQFETNVFGLVQMCQLVLPGMRRAEGGRIINVSSMGGEFTTPLAGVYHASKYAVEALSDALRFEVQPFGVDVIVIQPGAVDTPLAEATAQSIQTHIGSPYTHQVAGFRAASEAMMQQRHALLSEPAEVAAVILEAATSPQPLTRYKIGATGEQMVATRKSMSDREWDALFRQQYGLGE
jgi:NAD(P)-dependent dehydrogenase (short-subunit alcohol dehydrogenase family)